MNACMIALDPTGRFACLTRPTTDGLSILALDWDHHRMEKIRRELAQVTDLLPEAGPPVLYRTGSGIHAIYPNLVKWAEVKSLFFLILDGLTLIQDYPDSRYITDLDGDWTVCPGYISYALHYQQVYIRVGLKPGRQPDIVRLPALSEILRIHDQGLDEYQQAVTEQEAVPTVEEMVPTPTLLDRAISLWRKVVRGVRTRILHSHFCADCGQWFYLSRDDMERGIIPVYCADCEARSIPF